MDIQVIKLDATYNVIEEMNNTIGKSSDKVSSEIRRITNNINAHWRGEDATNHINNWIDQYDELSVYFDNINQVFNFLQNYFVNLQTCRSRATEINRVGDKIYRHIEYEPFEKKMPTSEFYYDEQLEKDYADVCELCNFYEDFIKITDRSMSVVLDNWLIGNGRDKMKKSYDDIVVSSKKMTTKLNELKDDLGTSISNMKTVNNS